MNKTLIVVGACFLAVGLSVPVASAETPTPYHLVLRSSIQHDISPRLRDLHPVPSTPKSGVRVIPLQRRPPRLRGATPDQQGARHDPVIQDWHGETSALSPLQSFEGLSNAMNQQAIGHLVVPPDPNGDVGPNHYVQWVNLIIGVFDKQGNLLAGGPGNIVWSGFGGLCETENQGDPIVLYDHLANRWFLSQFAFATDANGRRIGPFLQCIAVSMTPDPTGAYYRYAFQISDTNMNDYPKFGVWGDAYYMSVNQFAVDTGAFMGVGVAAFSRRTMLLGLPAQMLFGTLPPNFFGLLPADLDGPPPPLGTPNFFASFSEPPDSPSDQLNIWQFHVDFQNPANATFGLNGQPNVTLATAPFNTDFGLFCQYLNLCILQPATLRRVDATPDRLMYRLQYRYFGGYQTLVTNHAVNAVNGLPGKAGIRWYELRDDGSGWNIFQQGTYAPDGDSRWMGGAAMDRQGNIALGFSVSSAATFPSIRYVGRLASDPLGTLPQGETTLIAGSGSQTAHYPGNRWGDYSMLAVDPSDDCTFWYTQEYYATTSLVGWQTRIGAFKFPSCGTP